MLKCYRFSDTTLSIGPDPGIDPGMCVTDLFADGAIRLTVSYDSPDEPKVEITVPASLRVTPENDDPLAAERSRSDMSGPDDNTFDSFLHEEARRVEFESTTIKELKVKRSRAQARRNAG